MSRLAWRSTFAALVLALVTAWVALSGTTHHAPPPLTGALIPLAVSTTQSTFDVPIAAPEDRYLVMVSSLARTPGPFAVTLSTHVVPTAQPWSVLSTNPSPDWTHQTDALRAELEGSHNRVVLARAEASHADPPPTKVFHLFVRERDLGDPNNYVTVTARLLTLGRHCAVYGDVADNPDSFSGELLRDIADTFDNHVMPVAEARLGRHADIDLDGRFTILLTSWLDRLENGKVALGGFVRGSDFYRDLPAPFSNACDMMYLSANLQPGPHLRTLLAHEYTHAVIFSEHVLSDWLPGAARLDEEGWLNEALAHLAEDLHGFSWSNLDFRIAAFLNAPHRYQLVVDDYYGADLWRSHGNRGATYLFLRWCADRYGIDILRRLIQTNLRGTRNLEVALGEPFEELYRRWSAALFLAGTGWTTDPDFSIGRPSLRAPLEGRVLAGPYYEHLDLPAGSSSRFNLAGTSTAYFLVSSSAGQPGRLMLTAPRAAQLQLSVLRLPADLPILRLSVFPEAGSPNDAPWLVPTSPSAERVRLKIEHLAGSPITLEQLSFERLTPPSTQPARQPFRFKTLAPAEIHALFAGCDLSVGHSRLSQPVSLSPAAPEDAELVFKLTATDPQGRHHAAWATLNLHADHSSDLALHAHR